RRVPDFWCDAVASVQESGHPDLSGCTLPVQPEENPGLRVQGEAPDLGEGWTWSDMASTACPLTVSMLALLLEQHHGLAPAAIKDLMIRATSELMAAPSAIAEGSAALDAIKRITPGIGPRLPGVNDQLAALATSVQAALPETEAAS
ncbi:MAG: hypothetical protein ACR2RE_15940, partial [Geminicoccaceae bacterium]